MGDEKRSEVTEVYAALSHSLRKKIIEFIGEKGFAGFKDLKDTLNVSIGTLYYHLDMLKGFVAQNQQRKYVLTDRGKLALRLVGSSEEKLKEAGITIQPKEPSAFSSVAREILFGRRLFASVSSNPLRFIPEALIVMGLGAWIFFQAGIEPVMMFYNHPSTMPSFLVVVAEFFGAWLIVFGLSEILSIGFYRRFGGEKNLLVSIAFSFSPLLIIPFALDVARLISPGIVFNWTLINIFFLIIQAWVLLLLTAALGFSKGLKLENAALISLTVIYFNIVIFLLIVLGF